MTHTHTQRGNWMNALYCVRVCICVCVPLFHKYIGFCSFVRGFSRGSLSRRVLECKLVTTFSCVINYASVLLGWMLSTKAEYVRIVQTNKINKFWQKNSNPFSMANGLEINSTKSISIKNAVQCVYGWLATKKLLSHRFFEQIFGAIRVTLVCVVCGAVLFHLLDCHLFERHFQLFTQGLFRHFFCINIWYWLLPSHSTATHTVVVIIFIIADYTNIHSMNRVKLI